MLTTYKRIVLCLGFALVFGSILPFAWSADKTPSLPQKPSIKPSILTLEEMTQEIEKALKANPDVFGAGTSLVKAEIVLDEVQITLSQDFQVNAAKASKADQAVAIIAFIASGYSRSRIFIQTQQGQKSLDDFVRIKKTPTSRSRANFAPGISPVSNGSQYPYSGPLSGKSIVVSPGHGILWYSSNSAWGFQRSQVYGIIEDLTNWRMGEHIIDALERTGAYVFSCRERDIRTEEIIVDDDNPSSGYSDGEGWFTSSSTGYKGGTYRARATGTPGSELPVASWKPTFPQSGNYAIYVQFREGANRANDAHYRIRHAGGESLVEVNQQMNSLRWLYIGTYPFHAGASFGEGLELVPESTKADSYVIADAVKFGGGMGDIKRNGATSGKARWQEAARYWVENVGAPGAVYNSTWADDDADVTTRPLYANWQGADAFISLHSNAAGSGNQGYGTETYMYNGTATTGSQRWRDLVHNSVLSAIRSEWDEDWTDRGKRTANFGEVRELDSAPGCLIEVGFHDTEYDAAFLKRPPFRNTVARAIAKAALDYFNTGKPVFPLPVRDFFIKALPYGAVRLSWQASPETAWPGSEPTAYRIYISKNGDGFDNGTHYTTGTSMTFSDLEPGAVYAFRVAARNGGGQSVLSETLVARVHPGIEPGILIVNAFDRLDRSVQEEANTRNFATLHAQSMAKAGHYYFVSSSNEAIEDGLVDLDDFSMLDWLSGEEARLGGETADFLSFSPTEQTHLRSYVQGGGSLLVTGSEIGWDVMESSAGETSYKSFYNDVLKADYVDDDANEYNFAGVNGSLFQGLSGTFDNGVQYGVYDVDFPEVISGRDGAEICMKYSAGTGLGICYDGDYRLVYLGVPLETFGSRDAITKRILEFLTFEQLPPELENEPELEVEREPEQENIVVDGDPEWDMDDETPLEIETTDDSLESEIFNPDGDLDFTPDGDSDSVLDNDDTNGDEDKNQAEDSDDDASIPEDGDSDLDSSVTPDGDLNSSDGDAASESDSSEFSNEIAEQDQADGDSWFGPTEIPDHGGTGEDSCQNTPKNAFGETLALLLLLFALRRKQNHEKHE